MLRAALFLSMTFKLLFSLPLFLFVSVFSSRTAPLSLTSLLSVCFPTASRNKTAFRFFPFIVFPLASKLRRSNSTKSTIPFTISCPNVTHLSNCSVVILWMAGDFNRKVQGTAAALAVVQVLLLEPLPPPPITASRMIRAKQWSK